MGCTGINLMTKNKEVFWGRTQEFELNFDYAGVKIPRNWNYDSMYTPYKTKYAVMGIAWAENDVRKYPVLLDGINENGLVGGSFYFDNFYKYKPADEIKKEGKIPLRGEEVGTWILTNYKDVDDIVENLNKDIAVTSEPGPMTGRSMPQHTIFQDESGKCVVVEPTREDGFDIYENPIGVFTNAPDFKWHLTNLKTHLERSSYRKYKYTIEEPIERFKEDEFTNGLMGVSSDFKPESRFLRAAYNKLLSVEVDRENALIQLIHLLATVDNPIGSLRIYNDDKLIMPWTQFALYHDVSEKILYIHFYENRTLQKLKFDDNDYDKDDIEYFRFHKDEVIVDMIKDNN